MTAIQAAHRHAAIIRQLSSERDYNKVRKLHAEREQLIAEHPDAEDITSERMAREYSASLRGDRKMRIADPEPSSAGSELVPASSAAGEPSARSGGRRASRRAARGGSGRVSRRRRSGRAASRVLEQSGAAPAARSATRVGLQVAGALVGLALLYLFLTDAEKRGRGSAIAQLSMTGAGLVKAFVAPTDPLAHLAGGQAGSSSSGQLLPSGIPVPGASGVLGSPDGGKTLTLPAPKSDPGGVKVATKNPSGAPSWGVDSSGVHIAGYEIPWLPF